MQPALWHRRLFDNRSWDLAEGFANLREPIVGVKCLGGSRKPPKLSGALVPVALRGRSANPDNPFSSSCEAAETRVRADGFVSADNHNVLGSCCVSGSYLTSNSISD